MLGSRLDKYPSTLTTWKKWRKRYPKTSVLSIDTGFKRNYTIDPYASYYSKKKRLFSFLGKGDERDEKFLIIGIEQNGVARAYRLEDVRRRKVIEDRLAAKKVKITFDEHTYQVTVNSPEGLALPHMTTYWFVWKGIYPDSELIGSGPQ